MGFIIIIALLEKKVFNISLPFCMETGGVAAGFIWLGYICREKIDRVYSKVKWKVIIGACIVFLFGNATQYVFKLGKVNFNTLEIGNIVTFLLNALSGIYITIWCSKKIKNQSVINYLGRKSLYVFGIHYLFLEICCKFDAGIPMKGTSFLFTIVITLLCFYVCKIIDKVKKI